MCTQSYDETDSEVLCTHRAMVRLTVKCESYDETNSEVLCAHRAMVRLTVKYYVHTELC